MRALVLVFGLAVSVQIRVDAQLAPVNESELSLGHMHIFPADRGKEAKAWLALGGQLEYNLSNNIPIGFPGIIILIGNPKPANLGSAGSVIDHVAFRVPNLDVTVTRIKGVETWWKNATWGWTVEPARTAKSAFATTPGGIRVEILEDKSPKVPIVFDHVHYYIDEARLKPMEEYYVTMFGAKPIKGQTDTLSVPGGNLVFSKSDAPPLPTTGRTLDHVGFNMLNGAALAAYSKILEEKGTNDGSSLCPRINGHDTPGDGFWDQHRDHEGAECVF